MKSIQEKLQADVLEAYELLSRQDKKMPTMRLYSLVAKRCGVKMSQVKGIIAQEEEYTNN